jgi:hypothetical protein
VASRSQCLSPTPWATTPFSTRFSARVIFLSCSQYRPEIRSPERGFGSHSATECECGPSPLGGVEADWRPEEPRDAVGTTVYLTTGKIRQRADVISGGSFASANDPRVHFGLGDASAIDDAEIRWPSGTVEKIHPPAVDRLFCVEEGKGIRKELCVSPTAGHP